MKKPLWKLFLLILTIAWISDAKAFEYGDHGKHDPFWPLVAADGSYISYDGNAAVVTMLLEGVVVDSSGNNVAIINGKMVKPGDKIGSYKVEMIANDRVNLIQGDERLSLKLKKGKI